MDCSFPIPFVKMSGTGNDFVIIDHRNPFVSREEQVGFVKKICRRMFSVGADGIIFIESSERADFSWSFYNGDGSEAEMCGNGARCAARYAFRKNIAGRTMSFETRAGIIKAEICGAEELVRVELTRPVDMRDDLTITLDGERKELLFINTGVPHAVLFTDDKEVPVKKWGREIRFHEIFEPAGTNANFVTVLEDGKLLVRTYERGVEDETMACGTGAVASAVLAAVQKKVCSPVQVVTTGGEALTVTFDLLEGSKIERVYLTGPARIIYEGSLTAESLL